MEKKSYELLAEASPDELLSCIQLLAISVVQHRAKCGFVTLSQSTNELRSISPELDTASTAEATGLFLQGREVVEEALEMIRSLALATPTVPIVVSEPDSTPTDKRTQFRINVTVPAKVLWPTDSKPVDAKLENISWGGALIHVEEARID